MRPNFWLIAACVLLGAACPAAGAPAQPTAIRYDIPAQRLDRALLRLGALSGSQISFAPQSVRGKTSRTVRGALSLTDALQRMLPDDSLVGEVSGPIVLVLPAPRARIVAAVARSDDEPPRRIHSPDAVTAAAAPVPIAELTVSALKYETLLQKTPMSISVQGRGLSERGDASISDFYRRASGLHLTASSASLQRLSIRGVRSAGEATTGVYYDETPVTGPAGSAADAGSSQPDLNLFDTQRIEILRGPQGTLYGAGSMGGTMRVLFNKPDLDQASGRVEVRGRATEHGAPGASARLMLNMPLIADVLAVRLAAYAEETGGYIDNVRLGRDDINGSHQVGARLSAALTPTNDLSLLLTGVHQRDRADDSVGYWMRALGRYRTDAAIVGAHDSDIDLVNATAKWDRPWGQLLGTVSRYGWKTLNITDYTNVLQRAAADPAACRAFFSLNGACGPDQAAAFADYAQGRTPGAWNQAATLHAYSHELRFTSPVGRPLSWTLGYFYENRRDHFDSIVNRADPATGAVVLAAEEITGYRYIDTIVRQTAFFGEANFRPVEALTFTLGARRYRYDKTVGGEVITPNRITLSDVTPFREVAARAEGWVTKLAVSYAVSSDVMLYASRSEGFRPGGANNVPGAGSAVPETYAPDALVSYEAGAKTAWFADRLNINLAAYHIDWDQMQVSVSSTSGAWRFNTNAGMARINGGEAEVVLRPVEGLWLSATVAAIDARLIEDQRNGLGMASGVAGDRLPFTPRWTAAFSTVYRATVLDAYNATVRFDYTYTGEAASDFHPGLAAYEKQPAYGLVDVQLGAARGGVEAYLRLTNLFDVRAPAMVTSNASVRGLTYSATPRALTLVLKRSF